MEGALQKCRVASIDGECSTLWHDAVWVGLCALGAMSAVRQGQRGRCREH